MITMGLRLLTLTVTLALLSVSAVLPASAESPGGQPCIWQIRPGVALQCRTFAQTPDDHENIWSEYRTLFATVRALMREIAQRVGTATKPDEEHEAVRRGIDAEVERIVPKILESARSQPPSSGRPGCITERRQQNGLTQTRVQCHDQQSSITTSSRGIVETYSSVSLSSTTASSSR